MISFEEIEVGSVYTPIFKIYTTDNSQLITTDDCFLVVGKKKLAIHGSEKFRLEILFNDMKQILVFTKHLRTVKIIPIKILM
jgi:hypothetical protein